MTASPPLEAAVPDYRGGGIVNLMVSIAHTFGAELETYPPLRALPPAMLTGQNVVLLVVDGLGHDNLLAHRPGGALARHLKSRITTVFPATTATAITTFLTGTAPQQHGVTGWFMYFRELGGVLAPLPYRPRHGGSAPTRSARDLFDHVPLFDRLRARCHVVAPSRIVHSEFNRAHNGAAHAHSCATLAQMSMTVTRIVAASRRPSYVYAYWPELDKLAHEHGIGSREAVRHLAEIDAAFEELLLAIDGTGTTVIVTGDHGFVDARAEETIELDDHPELERTLVLPLCGERRAAYCYVRADRRAEFVDYVGAQLQEHSDLRSRDEVIESGYFGLGAPHARLHERVGDYVLIMKRSAIIKDWLPGEARYVHVGVHGAMSAQELYVPLIVAQV